MWPCGSRNGAHRTPWRWCAKASKHHGRRMEVVELETRRQTPTFAPSITYSPNAAPTVARAPAQHVPGCQTRKTKLQSHKLTSTRTRVKPVSSQIARAMAASQSASLEVGGPGPLSYQQGETQQQRRTAVKKGIRCKSQGRLTDRHPGSFFFCDSATTKPSTEASQVPDPHAVSW